MRATERLIRKLQISTALDADDLKAIEHLPIITKELTSHTAVVREGERPSQSGLLIDGFLCRSKTTDAGKRQILSIHIPGDVPDLQSLHLHVMDHDLTTLSASTVAFIPHDALRTLTRERPRVAEALWRETLIDAAIFRETITNIGKRETTTRLAHFLCEQFYRAKAAGLVKENACDLPLSQTQIADALASSLTGIIRAMQALRKTQSFELRGGRLHIRNWRRLAEYGDFSPSYLHLRRPLRMS